MMKALKFTILATLVGVAGDAGAAEPIMTCASPTGHSYYDSEKWQDDGMSNAIVSLVRDEKGELDVKILKHNRH